ncbi:MAG: NPCBM/NEW2 domain-containing protein [Armatimonadetes bacterium]|nr:NPCBM/NEW2 domain-containing protein [Armatimonadota bacterium]
MVPLTLALALAAPVELHGAVTGSDANPGTAAQPLASLQGARDAVRGLKAKGPLPAGGVTVTVHGGIYPVRSTTAFAEQDSGTAAAPIVYRAAAGGEVRLNGGQVIPPGAWQPVTEPAVLARLPEESRARVRVADLRALGVTDYGKLEPYGFGNPSRTGPPELFVNGRAMTLARYPNTGWLRLEKVLDRGSVMGSNVPGEPALNEKPDRGAIFEVPDPHLARWTTAADAWLFGYWWWDWADSAVRVEKIDLEQRTIKTVQPHVYGFRAGGRYYAFNLLEELDQPGEWYLDRTSGRLYLDPPEPLAEATVAISLLATPMITTTNASYLTFQGLTFETTRGTAVEISGGSDVLIAGCCFRQTARNVVSIAGGTHHGVQSCDIHDTNGGVHMSGGDRNGLTPAGHFCDNNHFRNFARLNRTYNAAIHLYGVGLRAAHNLIHDSPHTGIFFGGNDHVIELNEFYDLCQETSDAGVIYGGRDWTARGNVIRYNFIHDILGIGGVGAFGIYLDDNFSSADVYSNVLCNLPNAAFLIGGGRDNLIHDNVTIHTGPLILDNRGMGWAHSGCEPGGDPYDSFKRTPVDQEPWRTRYPQLLTLLADDPKVPKYNVVERNVFYLSAPPNVAQPAVEFGTVRDNWVTDDDPGFVDAAAMDFRMRPGAPVLQHVPGFQPGPFEMIGLHVDAYRRSVPPAAPAVTPGSSTFVDEVAVTLATRTPNAAIRYTTDGKPPTARATLYARPIRLTATTTLKAAAFAGTARSDVTTATLTARRLADGIQLSELPAHDVHVYGELKRDTNWSGGAIKLGGQRFAHGLMMHPRAKPDGGAEATFELTGGLAKAARLLASIGVEDEMLGRGGSVTFIVEVHRAGQWERVFESEVLKVGGAPHAIEVPIAGADQLRLRTTDGGDDINCDHACWAEVRLTR